LVSDRYFLKKTLNLHHQIFLQKMTKLPTAIDETKIGSYPGSVPAGGGYVWDDVLEYRVWCHPEDGAPDLAKGSDYFFTFSTFEEALQYSKTNKGSEEPLALVLQKEYIDEPEQGKFVHKKEERMAEWPLSFLSRPKRTERTIPDFLAPDAPGNRLDILRGIS
jgi:hypothetical protein